MPETPPVPARLLTGRYTSVVDGYSHAATDAASSQGAHQWHDQLKAACGSVTFLGVAVAPCDDEGRLHLLGPAEVVVAATGGHAEALCGRALPAAGLTLTHGSSGAVCMDCVNGIPSDPGPRGTP